MQNSRSNEIKVGVVTLIAIVIAVLGIGYIKNTGLVGEENTVQFLFDRSAGISESAPIFVNGVERGKVTGTENYEGKVKISGYLDRKNDLKADATAEIMILELTGGKKIDINPGNSDQKFASGLIPGVAVSDLSELVSVVNDVSGDAISLIRRLDTISLSISRVMKDTTLFSDIGTTISNVKELSISANSFMNANKGKLNDLVDNLADISEKLDNSIDRNEPKISSLIDELDLAVSDAKNLLSSANNTTEQINHLIDDINQLVNDIKTEKSIINKILYDKEFASKLDSAFTDLGSFVKMIEEYGVNVNLRIGTRP